MQELHELLRQRVFFFGLFLAFDMNSTFLHLFCVEVKDSGDQSFDFWFAEELIQFAKELIQSGNFISHTVKITFR